MISRSLVSGRLLCRGWTGLDTQVAEQGGHVGSEMFAALSEPGGGGSSGLPDPRRLTRQRLPRREPGSGARIGPFCLSRGPLRGGAGGQGSELGRGRSSARSMRRAARRPECDIHVRLPPRIAIPCHEKVTCRFVRRIKNHF
jgi:hypothetical protein